MEAILNCGVVESNRRLDCNNICAGDGNHGIDRGERSTGGSAIEWNYMLVRCFERVFAGKKLNLFLLRGLRQSWRLHQRSVHSAGWKTQA